MNEIGEKEEVIAPERWCSGMKGGGGGGVGRGH